MEKHQEPSIKPQASKTDHVKVKRSGAFGVWYLKFIWGLELGIWCFAGHAQNVIEDRATGPTAPPIRISGTQTLALINVPSASVAFRTRSAEAARIAGKLDRHVTEFLDGAPWMPFHHTLGISGYEACFNHPDEMFYALSLALPFLPTNTTARTKALLG